MLFRSISRVNNALIFAGVMILSFYHIEYIYDKEVSFSLITLFFLIYFFYLFKNESKALYILLGYYILIPIFPRSILDDYSILESGTTYYSLHSISFGPINLLLFATLIHTFICLLKTNFKQNKIHVIYFYACILSVLLSVIINLFQKHGIAYSGMNNSMGVLKPFIYLLIGSVLFHINRPKILSFLKFCSLLLGYRVLLFGIGDIFLFESLRLDYALSPYLTLSVYVMFLFKGYKLKLYEHIGFFLSFMFFSRAYILISLLLILLSIYYSKKNMRQKLKILSAISALILLIPIALYNFNSRLYNFMIWKLNITKFLSKNYEMSGSGKIRVLELKNIFSEISENVASLFFGKGPNGIYTFKNYPMNISQVGLESYSSDQLASGIYYSTHNFASFFMLKLGIIGLILYFITLFVSLRKEKKYSLLLILISLLCFIYNFWVAPILAIFFFNFFTLFERKSTHDISCINNI